VTRRPYRATPLRPPLEQVAPAARRRLGLVEPQGPGGRARAYGLLAGVAVVGLAVSVCELVLAAARWWR
jgi:hypothetical protein